MGLDLFDDLVDVDCGDLAGDLFADRGDLAVDLAGDLVDDLVIDRGDLAGIHGPSIGHLYIDHLEVLDLLFNLLLFDVLVDPQVSVGDLIEIKGRKEEKTECGLKRPSTASAIHSPSTCKRRERPCRRE